MAEQANDQTSATANDVSGTRVSRRTFLKASGAGALLTGATGGAVALQESTAYAQRRWTREVDVVVVGGGAAASSAALFAKEAGADVVVLEKGVVYGGTTAKSAGVFWIPNNFLMRQQGLVDRREDFLRYVARLSFPTLYNAADTERFGMPPDIHALHAVYYDQASATIDALRGPMKALAAEPWLEWQGKPMPDYYAQLPENKAPIGRALIPSRQGDVAGGASLILQLRRALEARQVPILLEHRVVRLVINGDGAVVGVEATNGDGATVAIRARRGVIFGSGGFTSNPEMSLNYLRGPIFGGCTVPTGEGDFVQLSSAVGAKLANMNNAWWWPVILEQALQFRSVPTGYAQNPGDSMVMVNAEGRRVVNEKIQYNERTQAHFVWDPVRSRYPNLITFVIYDESCRGRFGAGTGMIIRPGLAAPYVLSGNTLEELAAAIEARLSEIAPRTGGFRLDADFVANLKQTIARFNTFAETGKDLDFHRGEAPIEFAFHGPPRGNTMPNVTMRPIAATGPYYAVMTAAGTLDTKGGPKTNERSQVLNQEERPIPGLYGAGNCVASPAGQAYWAGGGTIGPALTFGAIAGRNAAAEAVKDAPIPS